MPLNEILIPNVVLMKKKKNSNQTISLEMCEIYTCILHPYSVSVYMIVVAIYAIKLDCFWYFAVKKTSFVVLIRELLIDPPP